jgi:haloalkane dehalogenase
MSTLIPLDRPRWLPEAAWPWPLSALSTSAGPIAFTDAGQGPALLLVHTGIWSFLWRDLLRGLTADFRCVTLDAPGNGLSHRPGRAGTTLAASAAAVRAVMDALDLRDVTLVVHDLGGPAGIAAAAERSERIRALVVMNAFAWAPPPRLDRMLAVMGSAPVRASNALTGWMPALTGAMGIGADARWDRAARAAFRAGWDRSGRAATHRYFADARRSNPLYAAIETSLRGSLAGRPMLTIFGERNDPFDFQGIWRRLFPHARQEVVARGHHFPMCEAPKAVAGWVGDWHRASVLTSGKADEAPS